MRATWSPSSSGRPRRRHEDSRISVSVRKTSKGPAPTILYAYGGFELSLGPGTERRPIRSAMLWLAQGGAIVVANIRGGGEFGPRLASGGAEGPIARTPSTISQRSRQISIKRGFATPKQLGIMGASNGGLLVSHDMVQRPELSARSSASVPLIDMLRYTQIRRGRVMGGRIWRSGRSRRSARIS